jgi:ubiquinone/menaquinone biosynthesis C-methylase UbiE
VSAVRLSVTEETLFQAKKDLIRERLNKYTRKAFRMLPELDKPRILDIGCGSGIPTIEITKLSKGEITGIDIHQPSLDRFIIRIKEEGLADFVKAVNCSMSDMEFAKESFDIIWSEGSIYVIGFKKGLMEWRRFIKSDGFLIVHDEKGNIEEKLKQVSDCGYQLLGHFILSEDTWWTEYFLPLEKLIGETRTKYADDPKVREQLHNAQWEIDMFKKDPERNSSAFLIMRKS